VWRRRRKEEGFCKRWIKKIKDRNHPLLFSFTSHSLWRLCLLNTLPSLSLSLSLSRLRSFFDVDFPLLESDVGITCVTAHKGLMCLAGL
jgi:hypothetical protein